MKLLKVIADNYRNCENQFTIDFMAKSKKTEEDKEYELQKIDEELYVFNTVAIVGKNASGKTSAIELLDCCYDILSTFRLDKVKFDCNGVKLQFYFYEEGYIYHYYTELKEAAEQVNRAVFVNQTLRRKRYYKSKMKEIFNESDWEEGFIHGELPEDVSILFFVLKNFKLREIYYGTEEDSLNNFDTNFSLIKKWDLSDAVVRSILKIFDENVDNLIQLDEHKYELTYLGEKKELSDKDLDRVLSSGTIKGFDLYVTAYASLKHGFDLVVDEIENHFHKSLVNNLICLYKDKTINRHNATLIFTTHYCEVLDLFNRSDNIWITKSKEKVYIENMYEKYDIRSELSKSKKFYENVFGTGVDYEALMRLKGLLMQ